MARFKIGELRGVVDTSLDKNSGNAIANSAVAAALETVVPEFLGAKSAAELKRQTDVLKVKDNTFTDFPASVNVFSEGIFAGPDGLILPTKEDASGGENLHGLFWRQKDSSNNWVYSNKSMMANSFNLPVYDPINDRYIVSGSVGVFYGTSSGTLPNRTITWAEYAHSGFRSGGNCAPSSFVVEYNGVTKCISLIGRACSNNGGADWYGITTDGTSPDRSPSVVIGSNVVAVTSTGGLEISKTLIPQMFTSSPSGSAITWSTVNINISSIGTKVLWLDVGKLSNGNEVVVATCERGWAYSYDGENWEHILTAATLPGYSLDLRRTTITKDGLVCLLMANSSAIMYTDMLGGSTIHTSAARIPINYPRTPVEVTDGLTTYYVTTSTTEFGLAVSTDCINWIELTAINFSGTDTQPILGNPVVYDGTIYFPTYDGTSYVRSMPVEKFFEMIALERVADQDLELIPEGPGSVYTNDELRSRVNECVAMINVLRRIVKG